MMPGKTIDVTREENHINIQFPKETADYSNILTAYDLPYKDAGYYLQVGEIIPVQGWILHISVIGMQVLDLLEALLPILISAKVPFKIPKDKSIASSLLACEYGYINLAKIVCIYPDDDSQALELAQQLIQLTMPFRGPDIPTDLLLGAAVYTRYGSFQPVLKPDIEGNIQKYIYDYQGNLVLDSYAVPFQLPVGINWPFASIAAPTVPPRKKFLNDCIKPVAVIKADVKGSVFKGVYFKSWFKMKPCLIKEGKKNMWADKYGRDIQDSLEWQMKIHNNLCGEVPTPRILDFFRENGDCYLVMEFIKGLTLNEKIGALYEGNKCWADLSLNSRLLLLDYLLEITEIIRKIHHKNYVHRDITPANFIIDKKNKLHIIDFEITYSVSQQTPNPPFGGATMGFMSPEQLSNDIPTVKEDIHALGALMIVVFACLTPFKFETTSQVTLRKDLYFFIPDVEIVDLIANCLNTDARLRPELPAIQDILRQYRKRVLQSPRLSEMPGIVINKEELAAIVGKSLNGLCSELMAIDNLWVSNEASINQLVGNQQMPDALLPGIYEGMAGVVLMLSKLKSSGFEMEGFVENCYQENIEYIQQHYLTALHNVPSGLYTGSAGIALTLAAGMQCNLVKSTGSNIQAIHACLEQEPVGLDLASGAAGQGLAILQCLSYLPDNFASARLQQLVALLLEQQQKDGSWTMWTADSTKSVKISGLALGNSGIICFLLAVADRFKNDQVKQAAVNGLYWLQKQAVKKDNTFTWPVHSDTKQTNPWVHLGSAGIALTFINAYESLHDPIYKNIAAGALYSHPHRISTGELSHAHGLAGLGEVYLEAHRVLKTDEWQARADWIAGCLLHLTKQSDGEGRYWLTNITDPVPTADFMTGNSGIIHFLCRYLVPDKLHYPLLPTL